MHMFLSNLANRQTDKQTNGQKHVPPRLSEVNKVKANDTAVSHYVRSTYDRAVQIIHS